MGADQTPNPTAWSDDQLDNLLDALAERATERDDLELPGGGPSRRTVLAGLLGAGGLGLGATQLGAAASWGSATGTIGTDAEPVDTANVRDLDAKLMDTEQLSLPGVTALTRDVNLDGGSNKPIFSVDNVSEGAAGEIIVAGDESSANRGGFDKVFYSHDRLKIEEKIPKSDFFESFQLSIDGTTVEFTDGGDGASGDVTIIALIAGPQNDFKFLI